MAYTAIDIHHLKGLKAATHKRRCQEKKDHLGTARLEEEVYKTEKDIGQG